MRQKELRIALICYGGVSLAVYMHGVTKELWHLARASRDFIGGDAPTPGGSAAVYRDLLGAIADRHGLRLRILPDIVAGASAGGINGVFLAQALHSGQSLEPLTEMWLADADIDVLTDPDARPFSRITKAWAMPIVWYLLTRPGNAVSDSVAPETRAEVRGKLSRLIRARWFAPPFSGLGFSRLIANAFAAMAASPAEAPLLPAGHPLDLFVTATDFKGHLEMLRLNSPPLVEESEHRVSIGFRAATAATPGLPLAPLPELIFAARATASFPGAFPALRIAEIDKLVADGGMEWSGREAFLARIMPQHARRGDLDGVSLIDGSVLVNAPFAQAMAVLRDRPAQREIDRRFVYIDPHPDRVDDKVRADPRPIGFFATIFGSLSSIPREQPVRDNLEALAYQSKEMARLRAIVTALRPEVEEAVERLFGRTLFLNHPTAKRLVAWRARAQQAASEQSGFAFHGYAQIKAGAIVDGLAALIHAAAPGLGLDNPGPIAHALWDYLASTGLDRLSGMRGGANAAAIAFFREHDLAFRIRRLRLLARRLAQDWEDDPAIPQSARDAARAAVFESLSLYFAHEPAASLGPHFGKVASAVFKDPGAVLEHIAASRRLAEHDLKVDELLAAAMAAMPTALRRRMLLAYLGFPFFDTATLPLLRDEGSTEFDPVKVDRISPEDALSIRAGGTQATLRGTEFYNFGAFFSRAYRENDYLWGRLHGAERMIDLVVSALPPGEIISSKLIFEFKRRAFLAVLKEEEPRLGVDAALIPGLRAEVLALNLP